MLREFIQNNFWLKVFSLVLATLIWLVIEANFPQQDGRENREPQPMDAVRDIRRPVVLLTAATNRVLFNVEPADVSVKLRGDGAVLNKLAPAEIQAQVRLIDVPDPQGSFRVEVIAPRDVTVQQVWPAHVYVRTPPPPSPAETNALPDVR